MSITIRITVERDDTDREVDVICTGAGIESARDSETGEDIALARAESDEAWSEYLIALDEDRWARRESRSEACWGHL